MIEKKKINLKGYNIINQKGSIAMRKYILLFIIICGLILLSCQETRPDRSYVQTNVVEKSLFDGEWYYTRTVIDHDYESSWAGYYGLFKGDITYDTTLGTIARIRFVIDADYLYAYRSYVFVDGADPDGDDPEYIGDPIGAWKITKHFDIVRRYNADTGEELNVIEENDTERPWYEREYMRVDWSQNLFTAYYWNSLDMFEGYGLIERSAAPTYVQEGSSFPTEWEPQYLFTPESEPNAETNPGSALTFNEYGRRYYDMFGANQIYGISFVNQEIWSPEAYCLYYESSRPSAMQGKEIPCTSFMVSIKNFFLKVPKDDQYEPILVTNSVWDRFGVIRMEQPTYIVGDDADSEQGLGDYQGQTDFLNYWGARHNLWKQSYSIDPQTNERVSIPIYQREVDPIVYTLGAHFPQYLINPAFELIGEWNSAYMSTIRLSRQLGTELPSQYLTTTPCEDTSDCHTSVAGDNAFQQPNSICYKENQEDDSGFCTKPLPDRFIAGSNCDLTSECEDSYGDDFPGTTCVKPYATANNGMCTRPYNPYRTPDSNANDFDCYVVDGTGQIPNDPGRSLSSYNDPSFDCEANPETCPYTYHFEGSECALMLRVNSCDNPEILEGYSREYQNKGEEFNSEMICDQLGDLRYNFFYYIDIPGPWFAGVTIPMMDPENGRLVVSPIHITEESIQAGVTSLMEQLCLVAGSNMFSWCEGKEDEEVYMTGEDVRTYFAQQGYAVPPVGVITPVDFGRTDVNGNNALKNFNNLLERRMENAERLQGMEGRVALFSDRLRALAGTRFEEMLLSGNEARVLNGLAAVEVPSLSNDLLNQISPFRNPIPERWNRDNEFFERMNEHFMTPSPKDIIPYVDSSILDLAREEFQGLTEDQVAIQIARMYFRGVMIHEMGHALGMEHNFAASFDYDNYHDEYYNIDQGIPLPNRADFDSDGDGEFNYEEAANYAEEMRKTRENREEYGIVRWRGTSVMDYYGRWAPDLAPIGRYDNAFIHFLYGNQVEVYDADPLESSNVDADDVTYEPRSWLKRPDLVSRHYETFFHGGEECRIEYSPISGEVIKAYHEDCPYSAEAGTLPTGQVIKQQCVPNPAARTSPNVDLFGGICESYYDSASRVYEDRATSAPVDYLFCSNNRIGDISWCNQFDDGESYQEIVATFRDRYFRMYPFTNFRRYRSNWSGYSYWWMYSILAKFHQHFFYRYNYEWRDELIRYLMQHPTEDAEDYLKSKIGIWRHMVDMYDASADVMNFLSQIITMPDVGSYYYDTNTNSYELLQSEQLGEGDLDIRLGLGRYMWSSYQTGENGIFKVERAGSINDKIEALYALALRDWGTSWTYDERFMINMYELFPEGMSRLFGGLVAGNPLYYAPRVCREGDIGPDGEECETGTNDQYPMYYVNLYHGYCELFGGECERHDPTGAFYGQLSPVDGVSNDMLKTFAAIFSLAEFPFYWNPEYEQQLYVFVEGAGDSFSLPEGLVGCDINDIENNWEGCDYVKYNSPRMSNRTYVAMRVKRENEGEEDEGLPVFSVSFEMLKFANELENRVNELETCQDNNDLCGLGSEEARDEALDMARNRLDNTESFIENIREIQSVYGISTNL